MDCQIEPSASLGTKELREEAYLHRPIEVVGKGREEETLSYGDILEDLYSLVIPARSDCMLLWSLIKYVDEGANKKVERPAMKPDDS